MGEEGFTVKKTQPRHLLAYVSSQSTYWEMSNYIWVQSDCTLAESETHAELGAESTFCF